MPACPFPCRGCLVAGRCPNEALPATSTPAPRQPPREPPRPPRRAVAPTMPRGVPRAIALQCGHVTTDEAVIFYSVWQYTPGDLWCETCHDWVPVLVTPKAEESREPMF